MRVGKQPDNHLRARDAVWAQVLQFELTVQFELVYAKPRGPGRPGAAPLPQAARGCRRNCAEEERRRVRRAPARG